MQIPALVQAVKDAGTEGISGSGLGDCAIALGATDAEVPGYERIPAVFAAMTIGCGVGRMAGGTGSPL